MRAPCLRAAAAKRVGWDKKSIRQSALSIQGGRLHAKALDQSDPGERAGFRRGIASNLYELGANENIVQRVLRHAKPRVTKDR